MNETSSVLTRIPSCVIDIDGVFKYIQIHVKDATNQLLNKYIIRGSKRYNYHQQNFESFLEELAQDEELSNAIVYEIKGGGRINIQEKSQEINVYGYSTTYGQCDHSITCEVLKEAFPKHKITYSDEGY